MSWLEIFDVFAEYLGIILAALFFGKSELGGSLGFLGG